MKLGIVRETKTPPDRRVPLTPDHCKELLTRYSDLEIFVQPNEYRGSAEMGKSKYREEN